MSAQFRKMKMKRKITGKALSSLTKKAIWNHSRGDCNFPESSREKGDLSRRGSLALFRAQASQIGRAGANMDAGT